MVFRWPNEVLDGNTSEQKTPRLDRGIPTEATLSHMRERGVSYLVGTPKDRIIQYEKKWLELPWQQLRDSVQVKFHEHDRELYVLARILRELRAMRRRFRQAEHRDGHYLPRSNLTAEDPAGLWTRYIQLTQIEAAFRSSTIAWSIAWRRTSSSPSWLTIQMIDVWIPTCDGRWLVLPGYTQPAKDLQVLLDTLALALPSQPPPRICAPALPPPAVTPTPP